MSVRRKPTPSYLLHQQSGRARAVWTDSLGLRHQKLLPGAFDSPESRTAFARLQLELETSPTSGMTEPSGISVAEVLCAYLEHADGYYRTPADTPTAEVKEIKASIRPVRELYGLAPAAGFGPKSLAAVRQHMVGLGWCRGLINKRIDRVKRAFKWAVAEELVAPGVYDALRALPGLRRGRAEARESKPVQPVADEVVDATLPHLPHHVRVMVGLMRHTGMRPAEVCAMTPGAIDRTGPTWAYRPDHHKTAHRGKSRVIPLGPNAQALLSTFLMGRSVGPDDPIFSPAAAREERFVEMRRKRKCKVYPSQTAGRRKADPEKSPGLAYHPHAIAHAVRVACEKAFPLPTALAKRDGESRGRWWARLTEGQRVEVKSRRKAHHWHPYQIRHAYATRVRKEYGLEAAQVLLGHSRADVTQVYAERDEALAATVAGKIG